MTYEFTSPTLAFACLQQLVSGANSIEDKLAVLDEATEAGVASTVIEEVHTNTMEEEMNTCVFLLKIAKKALAGITARQVETYREEQRTKEELISSSEDNRRAASIIFALAVKAAKDAYDVLIEGEKVCSNLEKKITRLALLNIDSSDELDTFAEFSRLVAVAKNENEADIAEFARLPPITVPPPSSTGPSAPPSSSLWLNAARSSLYKSPEEERQWKRQKHELRKLQ